LERDADFERVDGVEAEPTAEQRRGGVDVRWREVLEAQRFDDQLFQFFRQV
jgi:hypothetical protein